MGRPKRLWGEAELRAAVLDSSSYADLRRRLGVYNSGSAHNSLKKMVDSFGIDTSHFDPYRSQRAGGPRKVLSTEERFRVYSPEESPDWKAIRKVYLTDHDLICAECGNLGEWRGRPLRLHLDHVDGNRWNNSLDNLRLLCPNCHDQTETWGRVSG